MTPEDPELSKILRRIDQRLAQEGLSSSDQGLLTALKANPSLLGLLTRYYHDKKSGQDRLWYQSNQLWNSLDKEVDVKKFSEKGSELKIDKKQLTRAINYDLLSISQQPEDIDPVCLVSLRRLLARQALRLRPSLSIKDEALMQRLKAKPQVVELVLVTEKKFLIDLFDQKVKLLRDQLNEQEQASIDSKFNTNSFSADFCLRQALREQKPNLYLLPSQELIQLLLTTELELWARQSQQQEEIFYHRFSIDETDKPEPIFGLPDLGLTMFTPDASKSMGVQAVLQLPGSPLILPLMIDGQASVGKKSGEINVHFGQMGKLGSFSSELKSE